MNSAGVNDLLRQPHWLIPTFIILILWFVIDRGVSSALSRAFRLVNLPKVTAEILVRLVRLLVAGLGLLLLSEAFGVAPRDLWGSVSTILALVAVGFVAFWSVLSNTVCGLLLLATAPFRIGDTIELFELGAAQEKKGLLGKVIEFSLFYLVIEGVGPEGTKEINYIPHNLVFQRGIRKFVQASNQEK